MPLVLPLAVFEGEALLRHLRHCRRRHRVQEDTKIQYSILLVCARSENFTIYSSCRNKLEPVCCTVMMLLVEQRISTRRGLILRHKCLPDQIYLKNEMVHMNLINDSCIYYIMNVCNDSWVALIILDRLLISLQLVWNERAKITPDVQINLKKIRGAFDD